MLTVNECAKQGIECFAMIHDSFGTYASDTPAMFEILRHKFAEMYDSNVLLELYEDMPDEVKAVLSPPPGQGTLDLDAVKLSEFFFA